MHARLVVYKDGKPDLSVPVAESGAGIGREAGNHVQLSSPEVSKRHAFLQHTAAGWQIRDLESRNGLFVNGKRVRETTLQNDDRMTIGPYTIIFDTTPSGSQYKSRLEIDLSSNVVQQTMTARRDNLR